MATSIKEAISLLREATFEAQSAYHENPTDENLLKLFQARYAFFDAVEGRGIQSPPSFTERLTEEEIQQKLSEYKSQWM